ncbi:succinate dehydrogenase/fumarate reductase iron-sulfur subunit [Sulfurimonas autotrophica]|uniref:Fumarate reductase iron-sulfur subunit n=1 Tax=Sulfurimonas autotrophica (strain ATCC BAA-671 / DSM 16294 / JCM 11897 / OK10) TaxID=563040 RepID=E0USS0_SULAO|nr:2Fe-2S iron-sulfur cluster-binding protein [Sulfurimonas autotrophica]ADN08097.1 succinate dehydrogenase subunit B [Sulfurimonas autotrophica DSM 16294]
MKVHVKRESDFVAYDVELPDATLLEVLSSIKTEQDNSLAFSSGCRSSVCGSCSMRVNEKEVLACAYKVQDGDVIEPLKNIEVIRDLVVNMDKALETKKRAKTWLQTYNKEAKLTHEDEKINALQSDCILCGSCYSACPVYAVNEEFLGPFALTGVWKYVSDKREAQPKEKIDTIQTNGVWDCTLCNECTLVCPQGISSKADIEKLRMKSTMAGYADPSFTQSFDGGFGFDGSPSF